MRDKFSYTDSTENKASSSARKARVCAAASCRASVWARLHPAYLGARLQPFDEHYSSRVAEQRWQFAAAIFRTGYVRQSFSLCVYGPS